MPLKIIPLFCLLICLSFPVNAQNENVHQKDFYNAVSTGESIFTAPLNFHSNDWVKFAGVIAATTGAYFLDNETQSFALRSRSSFNNNLFSIDKVYGSGYTLIGVGGIYFYGLIFDNGKVRNVGLQTIEAVGYAGLITSILKSLIGRSRPYTNDGHHKFSPFNFSAAHTSFPSGHSTVAFAFSTVLANNFDNVYLKILCYSGAGLVAAARVYHNAHWLSDVTMGAAIGYFIGDFVSGHQTGHQQEKVSFEVSPAVGGLNFRLNF